MITVDAILAVKGVNHFADSIGVRPGTVRVWKTRRCIPRRYWPEIVKAHPELTLDKLMEAERAGAQARASA
jgi:hypothetical protein